MLKNCYMRWALSRMGSSSREKRDIEQVDSGFEELSHRCNHLASKSALNLAKWPGEGCQFFLGLPLSDLEDISGFAKEGGDIYSEVGEMSKDINRHRSFKQE